MKKRNEELVKELESISRNFPDPRRHQPPVGYFEALPDQVLHRWRQQAPAVQKASFSFKRMFAAAAVLTGLCLGILWLTQYVQEQDIQTTFTSAEAYEYIFEHAGEFESLLFEDPSFPEDLPWESTSPEEAEQYLMDELSILDMETLF